MDFLQISASDPQFANVTAILCDPSCSGSGISSRQMTSVAEDVDEQRLHALAKMQQSIVLHALSCMSCVIGSLMLIVPNVQRVVYSTCSLHEIENECVVDAVLHNAPLFQCVQLFPKWPHRGHAHVFEDGIYILPAFMELTYAAINTIRAAPESSATNGFFVALFERKQPCPTEPPSTLSATTVPATSPTTSITTPSSRKKRKQSSLAAQSRKKPLIAS